MTQGEPAHAANGSDSSQKLSLTRLADSTKVLLRDGMEMNANDTTAALSAVAGSSEKAGLSRRPHTGHNQETGIVKDVLHNKNEGVSAQQSRSTGAMEFRTHQPISEFDTHEWSDWERLSRDEASAHGGSMALSLDVTSKSFLLSAYPFHHHVHKQQQHQQNVILGNPYNLQAVHTYSDGAEVVGFLTAASYTSEVYGLPESGMVLSIGHPHPYQFVDTHQANISYLDSLLDAPDVVSYLTQVRYTDDVYGLPLSLKRLIDRAREEVLHEETSSDGYNEGHRVAVRRLEMVRNHLIRKREKNSMANGGEAEGKSWLDGWEELEKFLQNE